jgi:hypothetical protein
VADLLLEAEPVDVRAGALGGRGRRLCGGAGRRRLICARADHGAQDERRQRRGGKRQPASTDGGLVSTHTRDHGGRRR